MSVSEEEFGRVMAIFAVAFGEENLSRERIELYYKSLNDLDIFQLSKAASEIVATRRYMSLPTIAEIRGAALGIDEEHIAVGAIKAWADANEILINSGGPSNDEVLNEAIRIAFGGWEGFGQTDTDNEPSDRKHFLACYRVAAKKIMEYKLLNPRTEEKLLK